VNIKDDKGIALPLVLMVMLILILLSTALWQYSMTDTKHVVMDEKNMQAHYVALSGAKVGSKILEEIIENTSK